MSSHGTQPCDTYDASAEDIADRTDECLGVIARHGLSGLVLRVTGTGFPYSTLVVNVVGCFLFGLVWVLAAERMTMTPETCTIVLLGFPGSFTTFCTFVFQSHWLIAHARCLLAAGNLLVMNLSGLAVFVLGLILGGVV